MHYANLAGTAYLLTYDAMTSAVKRLLSRFVSVMMQILYSSLAS